MRVDAFHTKCRNGAAEDNQAHAHEQLFGHGGDADFDNAEDNLFVKAEECLQGKFQLQVILAGDGYSQMP